MSVLIDNSITIYEALENIKNGKYVMPAFQRQYVWNMEQIEKLWDSILLDYPIATFLFWHVDDYNVSWDTYFCNFLSEVSFYSRKQAVSVNYELSNINVKITDTAVLDGQQRLTSLFLSLLGQAYVKQKYLQLLEGRSNGSKNAMRLVDYYNDMNEEQKAMFRKEALIPDDVSLELENFEEFYEKRKELLTTKIRQLLG